MTDIILILPILIIGLIIYLIFDYPKNHAENQRSISDATERAEQELINEMREKIIIFYGTEMISSKRLISFDDHYKEIKRIEQQLIGKHHE